MNPFFSSAEFRPRALIRLVLFLFLSFFILGISTVATNEVLEFTIRAVSIAGLFYIFIRFIDLREFKSVGLNVNRLWVKELILGFFAAGLTMLGIFFYEYLSGDLEIIGFGWESISNDIWLLPAVVFFVKMMSVGFYEEVVFRGYVLPNLKEGLTILKITPVQATIAAVLISSGVFGFAHYGNLNATIFAVLNIVLAGVMLSIPLILTGRLALSIGLHFGWNFFQGGVFGFRVSGQSVRHSIIEIQQGGNEFWTGGSFGPEGGAIGVLGVIFLMIVTLVYIRKIKGDFGLDDAYKSTFMENQESLLKSDELT